MIQKKALALVAAYLIGMGDAGVSNVIYTTVPIVWGDKSLPAFGVFKEGFYLNFPRFA